MAKRQILVGSLALAALATIAIKASASNDGTAPPSPSTAPTTTRALLEQVRVIDTRPDRPGYDRDCGPNHACSFGPAWTDDSTARDGHNGCDTRNDVLRRQLTAVTTRPGTNGCVVTAGTLHDPYTGRTITFRKTNARAVQIDHVYPLALAWDMGAASWPTTRRTRFANDTALNLLAVDGTTNQTKSDSGPGEWLPPQRTYRCAYATRYLRVAVTYHLPITHDDRAAIIHSCSGSEATTAQ